LWTIPTGREGRADLVASIGRKIRVEPFIELPLQGQGPASSSVEPLVATAILRKHTVWQEAPLHRRHLARTLAGRCTQRAPEVPQATWLRVSL